MSKWARAAFGSLYAIPSRNGLTRPSSVRGEGYRMAAMGEIFASDYVGDSDMDRVRLNEREQGVMMLAEHDLLFARQSLVLSGAGKCSIVKGLSEPTTFESHLIRVRLASKKANPLFYMYYFHSPVSPMHSIVQQGVQAGIRASDLEALDVVVPPKEVQDRIADKLSLFDSAIENARRQIALLEEAAMRLYREWFVVHTDQKWEKGAVRKWFEITIGRTPPRKIAANFSESATDQKWCSIKDLQNSNIFISETAERLTKQGVDSSKIHISPAGTIFLSFKLTVGKVAITLEPMATNEAIAHFETIDRALRDYTYCYLHEFQYDTLGSTSSIGKAINSEIVRDMPFVMPDAKTLARFSETVSPIFDQMQNRVVSIRSLTEARDRLLPKLMSGEIEV